MVQKTSSQIKSVLAKIVWVFIDLIVMILIRNFFSSYPFPQQPSHRYKAWGKKDRQAKTHPKGKERNFRWRKFSVHYAQSLFIQCRLSFFSRLIRVGLTPILTFPT